MEKLLVDRLDLARLRFLAIDDGAGDVEAGFARLKGLIPTRQAGSIGRAPENVLVKPGQPAGVGAALPGIILIRGQEVHRDGLLAHPGLHPVYPGADLGRRGAPAKEIVVVVEDEIALI